MINNKYDFAIIFDVVDGNPNGDPDAGNLPRIDAETGMGIVTDVCLKRKIRNYVQLTKKCISPYDIFVKEKAVLNDIVDSAYKAEEVSQKGADSEKDSAAISYLCSKFFDIRTFGAVLTKGKGANAGQVRGPVQLTFGRSVDPIVFTAHSITRMGVSNQKDKEKERTMARKSTVPYGLYGARGFVSPALAEQTGFSEDDLALLWESILNMFESDRSAARGLMSVKKLVIFKHNSHLGNAPSYKLFDLIKIAKKDPSAPARSFSDYDFSVGETPSGVEKTIRE